MRRINFTPSPFLLELLAILLVTCQPVSYQSGRTGWEFPYGQAALEATVKVVAIQEDDGISMRKAGSGAIIAEDGLIVTNEHTIRAAQYIEVALHDGVKMQAYLVMAEPKTDLALLRVEAGRLPHLKLGQSTSLQLGEPVFAIGNPQDLDFSLTSGVVGAFNRQLNIIRHYKPLERFIQTDVPINPGCSGGPLLNRRGELVGINTALSGRSGHFEGYSFAQPVELVKELLVYARLLEASASFTIKD